MKMLLAMSSAFLICLASPADAGEKSVDITGKWKILRPSGKEIHVDELNADEASDYVTFVAAVVQGNAVDIKDGKLHVVVAKTGNKLELNATLKIVGRYETIVARTMDDKVVFHGTYELRRDDLAFCINVPTKPMPLVFIDEPPKGRFLQFMRVKN